MTSWKNISRAASVESLLEELSTNAQLIFQSLDKNGRGYLEPWQLTDACDVDVSAEDKQDILQQMDFDGDGLISFDDFSKSFNQIVRRQSFLRGQLDALQSPESHISVNSSTSFNSNSRQGDIRKWSVKSLSFNSDEGTGGSSTGDIVGTEGGIKNIYARNNRSSIFRRIRARERHRMKVKSQKAVSRSNSVSSLDINEMSNEFDFLSCKDDIIELYEALSTKNAVLQKLFTRIMTEVLSNLHRLKKENAEMEIAVDVERQRHRADVERLAIELDQQIHKTQIVAREIVCSEFQERLQEKDSLICQLSKRVNRGHQCYSPEGFISATEEDGGSYDSGFVLKWQRANAESQIRELKAELAIARTQIVSLRHCYEGNAHELESHHTVIQELLKEKGALATETSLLKETNRRLYDVNDDLCTALKIASPIEPCQCDISSSSAQYTLSPSFHCLKKAVLEKATSSRPIDTSILADYEICGQVVGALNHRPKASTATDLMTSAAPIRMTAGRRKFATRPSSLVYAPQQEVHNQCESFVDFDPTTADSGVYSLQDVAELQSEVDADSALRFDTFNQSWVEAEANFENSPTKTTFHPVPCLYRNSSAFDCDTKTAQLHDSYNPMSPSAHRYADLSDSSGELARMLRSTVRNTGKMKRTRASTRNSRVRKHSHPTLLHAKSVDHPQARTLPASSTGWGDSVRLTDATTAQLEDPSIGKFHIMLAGDASVGKSSFLLRLCHNTFTTNTTATVGLDVKSKVLNVDKTATILQFWDTAGQERFRSISASFYRKADAILLLYDCTAETSFTNVRSWISLIRNSTVCDVTLMLVGNKVDLRPTKLNNDQRCVSETEGHQLARECKSLFIETSAKNGQNIEECVLRLALVLNSQRSTISKETSVQLDSKGIRKSQITQCC